MEDDSSVPLPSNAREYNENFTRLIEGIKTRHDGVVTTIGRRPTSCEEYQFATNNANAFLTTLNV